MDRSRCLELYGELAREAFGGRFHLESARGGQSLSSWASAHHALALRHLEPELGAEELRTLYAACQTESGLVLAQRPVADGTDETAFIGPPSAAYAVARLVLAEQAGADLLQRAVQQLDAIWVERLPPDTDLPVILHPLESATPQTPLFDGVVESRSGGERDQELQNLARSAAACGLDPDRALRAGHAFVVEDPVFCGWFLLALEQCRAASEKLGEATTAQKLAIRGGMIAEAIADRLWWEEEEVFVARDRQRDELLRAVTAGGVVPVASQALGEDGKARRTAARHLSPGGALWGAHGISYNPIVRDRTRDSDASPWSDNHASPATQLWAHLALVRVGRQADARVCRLQLETVIEEQGFLPYWDAATGEPGGEPDCAQATIALEMAASETA